MKKLLIPVIAAVLFITSCTEKANKDALSGYIEKRDSLKTQMATVSEQLAEIERKIAKLDTTKKLQQITIDSIKKGSFGHFFEVHGNVKIEENAQIFPEVPGKIEKILVGEGARVSKGAPLIQLDASTVISSINEIKNQLELAQKVFEKQSKLWEQEIGSEIQYLEAKTNKESLEKKLITLQQQLDMYTIRAPFSGKVDEIMPKVGESANPAMPVARILNLSKVYIEAEVSERYIGAVQSGTMVQIEFPGVDKKLVSKVTRTGDFINPANRTFKVQIELNNNDGSLKPNLLTVLKIRDYFNPETFTVPSNIIQQDRKGNNYFYTVNSHDGAFKVMKISINPGKSYDGVTEISEGIEAIIPFVDKGSRSVKQGDIVEIQE